MTNNNDLRYWLALSFINDIGPVTAKRLLAVFQTPQKILEASFNELKDIEEIGQLRAKRIYEFNSWDIVDKEIKNIDSNNIRIINYCDKEYPDALRQIDDSPILLYAKGSFTEHDRYAIAIVGSRRMTEYGKTIAYNISRELASFGLTIVSGMASGIDTVAHHGALKAGGRSIAVLGCGLDRPYPPENRDLFKKLSKSHCVISEFPMGTPPNKENFPKRNRLISGLSLGVLVIEATVNSGSLITANYALEQGKDVFAVPGGILNKSSEGTNGLIKKGAKLVQKSEDVLEELAPVLKGMIGSQKENSQKSTSDKLKGLEINDEEKAICNILGQEPKHIDLLSRESAVSTARLLSILLSLEIKGIVKQTDGKRFYMV